MQIFSEATLLIGILMYSTVHILYMFFYLENVDFDSVVCVSKSRADNFPRCFACREADGETTRRRLMSVRHFIHQLCAVSGCFS